MVIAGGAFLFLAMCVTSDVGIGWGFLIFLATIATLFALQVAFF